MYYRITLTCKTKEQLGALLDTALRVEGVTMTTLVLEWAKPTPSVEPKKQKKRPVRSPMLAKASNETTLLQVIEQTFQHKQFAPKAIMALAVARGIPKGSFYTTLISLAKQGKLERPEPGTYKLVKRKELANEA